MRCVESMLFDDVSPAPCHVLFPFVQLSEALNLHNIRDRVWQIQACSAKTGAGLQEGIEWVLKIVEGGKGTTEQKKN